MNTDSEAGLKFIYRASYQLFVFVALVGLVSVTLGMHT